MQAADHVLRRERDAVLNELVDQPERAVLRGRVRLLERSRGRPHTRRGRTSGRRRASCRVLGAPSRRGLASAFERTFAAMKRILLIGGSGQLGTALRAELAGDEIAAPAARRVRPGQRRAGGAARRRALRRCDQLRGIPQRRRLRARARQGVRRQYARGRRLRARLRRARHRVHDDQHRLRLRRHRDRARTRRRRAGTAHDLRRLETRRRAADAAQPDASTTSSARAASSARSARRAKATRSSTRCSARPNAASRRGWSPT